MHDRRRRGQFLYEAAVLWEGRQGPMGIADHGRNMAQERCCRLLEFGERGLCQACGGIPVLKCPCLAMLSLGKPCHERGHESVLKHHVGVVLILLELLWLLLLRLQELLLQLSLLLSLLLLVMQCIQRRLL